MEEKITTMLTESEQRREKLLEDAKNQIVADANKFIAKHHATMIGVFIYNRRVYIAGTDEELKMHVTKGMKFALETIYTLERVLKQQHYSTRSPRDFFISRSEKKYCKKFSNVTIFQFFGRLSSL